MKKKAHRTKLPVLAFEAENWPVEIKSRKVLGHGKRSERGTRAGASGALHTMPDLGRPFLQQYEALWLAPEPGSCGWGEARG